MTKHYRNHNIRFNMTDEGGVQAWERLHSAEVEQDFKSQFATSKMDWRIRWQKIIVN